MAKKLDAAVEQFNTYDKSLQGLQL